jgi:hypothetical protein
MKMVHISLTAALSTSENEWWTPEVVHPGLAQATGHPTDDAAD